MQPVLIFERDKPVQGPGGRELVEFRTELQNGGLVRLRPRHILI
jgi:hypothetical protein